ncbi:MAG: hypothetical protein AVDCRST_MAG10-3290, partial [uncultured Acidimicrobiales bacterium]
GYRCQHLPSGSRRHPGVRSRCHGFRCRPRHHRRHPHDRRRPGPHRQPADLRSLRVRWPPHRGHRQLRRRRPCRPSPRRLL